MTSRLRLWTPHTRLILISQLPLMGATIFSVANTSIDQTLAARLPAGSVSALNYANALNSLLIQSVVMATAWVALSDFSDIASTGDLDKLRQRARQYMIALTAVAAPLSVGVLLFAAPSIRLVFQRGAFTSHSTMLVSGAWAGYAWGLVPVAIGMVCVRLLNALHANGSLVIVGITMLPLNAVLDLILMRFYGVFGIGLSTSVVWTFSAAILLYQVVRRTGVLLDAPTVRLLLKTLLATGLAGLACLGTRLLLGSSTAAMVVSALVTITTIGGLYGALGLPGAILGKALSDRSRRPDSMPDLPK
jgi:putative peptidoglycan lipid II flippase